MYRVVTEDRVLQAELPGYRAYAARVRWRLLPGIW
jgi:protein-S-isoprenylcysteine O-methyltransferase Ste14